MRGKFTLMQNFRRQFKLMYFTGFKDGIVTLILLQLFCLYLFNKFF